MTLAINQFAQSVVKGFVDLKLSSSTIACQVYTSESPALVPGQCVKRVDSGGPGTLPVVTAVGADTDDIFGVVNYSQKNASFAAGSALEVSVFTGNYVYMEASAAISAQARVEYVVSGAKVALATSGKRVLGVALDKANAAGDLIRVYVDLPGILSA